MADVSEDRGAAQRMVLKTFLMLKIFLTAVVTGLVLLAVLNGVFGVKMYPKALVWPGLRLDLGLDRRGSTRHGACRLVSCLYDSRDQDLQGLRLNKRQA